MSQLGPLRNRAEKSDSFTDSLGLLTEGTPEGVRVMKQEFQRADLEALMGGDALLDGQELSCGFVRIAAVGLLMDYRAKRGEDPLFDMNFNSGRPVLPFPFTLEQFKAFCVWHPAFKWEVIDLEFTNSFCPWNAASQGNISDALDLAADDDTILELERRNQASAVLVRSILGISQVPEVVESAFGALQADKAGPVWGLKTSIQRVPGYRWHVYQAMKAAHIAGQPCPKAQQLLDTWKLKPPDRLKVIQLPNRDELEYRLETGKTKTATVRQIQAVIRNLLSK